MLKVKDVIVNMRLKVPNNLKKKVLEQAANRLALKIRQRTKQGVGFDGSTFPSYDPEYEDQKRRAGRMGESFWLRLSGDLFKSLQIKYSKAKQSISMYFQGQHTSYSFSGPAKKGKKKNVKGGALVLKATSGKTTANDKIAYHLNTKYRFFGISKDDRKAFNKILMNELEKWLKKVNQKKVDK